MSLLIRLLMWISDKSTPSRQTGRQRNCLSKITNNLPLSWMGYVTSGLVNNAFSSLGEVGIPPLLPIKTSFECCPFHNRYSRMHFILRVARSSRYFQSSARASKGVAFHLGQNRSSSPLSPAASRVKRAKRLVM